jgi:hypothetical protein
MFDWVFLCLLLEEVLILPGIVAIVSASVYFIGCGACLEDDEPVSVWTKKAVPPIVKILVVTFSVSLLVSITSAPSIVVDANIARIKIKYTHPQSIEKIEDGALEVVNKLDKLIDAGIKKVEE